MSKLLLSLVVVLVVLWAVTWLVIKVASGLVHLILFLALVVLVLAAFQRLRGRAHRGSIR